MDWTNITEDAEVKQLLEQRKQIEDKIRAIDENALIMYELEVLSIPNVVEPSLTCKCGRKTHGLNGGLCYPCWDAKQAK